MRTCDLWILQDGTLVSVGVSYDESSGNRVVMFKHALDADSWPMDVDAVTIVAPTQLAHWSVFQTRNAGSGRLFATDGVSQIWQSLDTGRTWSQIVSASWWPALAGFTTAQVVPGIDGGAVAVLTEQSVAWIGPGGGAPGYRFTWTQHFSRSLDNALTNWQPSSIISGTRFGNSTSISQIAGVGAGRLFVTGQNQNYYGDGNGIASYDMGRTWS